MSADKCRPRLLSPLQLHLFILLLFIAIPLSAQFTEFKKITPTEYAPDFRYGIKMAVAGGFGLISTAGPCRSITVSGTTSTSCGRVYFMKRNVSNKWTMLDDFDKPPVPFAYGQLRFGHEVATDGQTFAISRMDGSEIFFTPKIELYSVNGSGQFFFIKEVAYTFSQDYQPEQTPSGAYPIALSTGLLVMGSPNDVNRDPNNGDILSGGRVLIHSKDFGGTSNWGLQKTLAAPPSTGFGSAVAASSTYIVSGAPGSNAVFLYSKDQGGVNNWGLLKTISPVDQAAGDSFGNVMALAGNFMAVASPNDDDKGTDSGAIYLYGKDQGGVNNWGLIKKIVPTDGAPGDQFGYSLSFVGNDLVVGAPQDDDNGNNSGSSYHFSKDQGGTNTWGLVSKLKKAAGTYTEDRFGETVAIDNDELVIGVPFDDLQGVNSGAASLYKKNGNAYGFVNQWSAGVGAYYFGSSLDINSDAAIVNDKFIFSREYPTADAWGLIKGENVGLIFNGCGAELDVDLEGDYAYRATGGSCMTQEEGTVEVMLKDFGGANNWGDSKTITPTSATQYGVFGWKSSAFQDILVANAYQNAGSLSGQQTGTTRGEVYVFGRDFGGVNNWGQIKKLTAANSQIGDYFGYDLSVNNGVLAVSAPYFTGKGAVFMYGQNVGGTNTWGLIKRIDTPDGAAGDEFGKAVFLLNGTDLVISAPANDNSVGTDAGAVYLYKKDQGGANTWGFVKKLTSPVAKPNGRFGTKVSMSDEGLVVSDNGLGGPSPQPQDVFLYLTHQGGPDNYGYVGKLLPTDFGPLDSFGTSISILDNLIFVGAPTQDSPLGTDVGAAYLFYMPPPSPVLSAASAIASSSFSVSWSAVNNASGYKVYVSTTSDFSSFVPGYNGVAAAGSTLSITGLSANQTYYVSVKAVRTSGGESANSNTVSALTAPAAPIAGNATEVEATSFTANWGTVTGATSYNIELLDADGASVSGFPKSVATAGAAISGLASGKVYKYKVSSSNGATSIQSNQVSVLLKPGAPVAIKAESVDVGEFKAVWNATTGADSYELDVATDEAFATPLTGYSALAVNGTFKALSGLPTSKIKYWYRVRALNITGTSANSNVIDLITLEGTLTFSQPVVTGNKISVTLQGVTGIPSVKFYSKGITATTPFVEQALSSTTLTYEATTSSGDFDELGLQYHFAATDAKAIEPVMSAAFYIYNLVSVASASTIPFTAGLDGTTSTYEMFSVPYVLNEKSIASIFDEFEGADKTQWRLFRYQGDQSGEGGRYLEYPDNITNIDLGKGYWFNSKEKITIKTGEGEVSRANQSTPFTLTFDKGWNQIGNPYPFNLDWNAMKAANPTRGLNSLWLFEGGDYVKKDVLAKWKGAFVFSDNGGQVSFPVSAKTSAAGRVQTNEFGADPDEPAWQVPITLSLNGRNQISVVGMHPDASPSKDMFDEIARPRFFDYLEMNTRHDEFFAPDFISDVVPTGNTGDWTFTVSSNQRSGKGVLTWDQQTFSGSESKIALLDINSKMLVDMKTTGTYVFNWSEGAQFKILYSRKGELLPGITFLGNAYPNPFSSSVTIPIFLDHDQSKLQINFFDMLGRRIKTIGVANMKAGIHSVEWDGKNDQAVPAENGVYLYQLTGDTGIISAPKRLIKH